MDRISELIEGAKLSERYKENLCKGRLTMESRTCRFAFSKEEDADLLCPLAVAAREMGLPYKKVCAVHNDELAAARLLSLPLAIVEEVRHAADYEGSDGIALLRAAGY